MNPINLLLPDGQPSTAWACGKCQQPASKQDATACCTEILCRICGKPTGYKRGNDTGSRILMAHNECFAVERSAKEAAWLDKAVKLETWDGWVYAHRGGQDGFFESVDAYVDYLADNFDPADWPEWVHVTKSRPGVSLDLGDILESHCDDGYDGMADDLQGSGELEAAIRAFNEANKSVLVYDMDLKRAVRVPRQ